MLKWLWGVAASAVIGCLAALPALAATEPPGGLQLVAADGGGGVALRADGLFPGASTERAIDLINIGEAMPGVTFSTEIEKSSVLDRDRDNGLQVSVDSCSEPWTKREGGSSCEGRAHHLVGSRHVAGGPLLLHGLEVEAPGGVDHLRLTLTLSPTAGEAAQGAVTTFGYSFTPSAT